jgi:hypothetical protein
MLDDNGLFTLNAGEVLGPAAHRARRPACRGKPNPAFSTQPRLPIVL